MSLAITAVDHDGLIFMPMLGDVGLRAMKREVLAMGMIRTGVGVVLLFAAGSLARADAVRAPAVACRTAPDAEKIATLLGKKDKAGAEALARPLVAAGACIDLARGIQVDVDDRRASLACVRLTGDLSCYWVASAFVDEHPGEKGPAGGGRRGGRRH